MDGSTRWIAIATLLGLVTAYALWGGRAPVVQDPEPPTPPSEVKPPQTVSTQPAQPQILRPPLTAPVPAAVSALKLNPPSVDFGEVKVTESKSLTVRVENTGTQTVEIEDVKGSCGCLKAEMAQRKIEPGKSATLNLGFTGHNGRRPESYTVTLRTDEADHPPVTLPIKGKVIQAFILEPQPLYFEDVAKGQSKTIEATITRCDGKPFTIKQVTASHKEFSFKWEPIPGSNNNAYKVFTTCTGIEPTAFTEGAAIVTDHPEVPAMPLRIGVRITGDVVSETQVLTAVQGSDARVAPFETVIKRVSPGVLLIKDITDSEKRPLEFSATRVEEGKFKVTITLKDIYPGTPPLGDFLIHSNVDDAPLHLPYRVVRQGAQLITNPNQLPKGFKP